MSDAFQLPKNLEKYFAALSKVYATSNKATVLEVLVNSQIRIHEEWTYDNWNGGTSGHAVYLVLAEQLYLEVLNQKDAIEKELKADINRIHHIPNEHIAAVFLEMEVLEDHDWRAASGLVRAGKRMVLPESEKRIWDGDGFRLFLSHKAEVASKTAELKGRLKTFGVSCFVAHKDIRPTKTWQDEIENALASMEGFAALLTENFHDSYWTDQEVGYALARGVPIIAVRMGCDPYGFIGRFQALTTNWDACAEDIVKLLIEHSGMYQAYIRALNRCSSFEEGNTLSKVLSAIERLSDQQIEELVVAYNGSAELQGSFGFNGKVKRKFGPGLVFYLNKLGTGSYQYGDTGLIKPVS